jgi:hypothetical protein
MLQQYEYATKIVQVGGLRKSDWVEVPRRLKPRFFTFYRGAESTAPPKGPHNPSEFRVHELRRCDRRGWLELLSQRFENDISDERGYQGNLKIGGCENIADGPGQTFLLAHAGALEFSHQQIGIKQEDDEAYLDDRSIKVFLHCEY